MKFSNGCWLQKERCECFSPAEVYFSKIEKDQVTICAPTSKITQRGDTLGGINLTIVISAPYEEVLRVQTYHHMGVQKKAPSFEIAPAESGHLKAEDTEDKLVIQAVHCVWKCRKRTEHSHFTAVRRKSLQADGEILHT